MFVYNSRISLFLRIAMVDALTSKTVAWEKEKGTQFTYDGVSSVSTEFLDYISFFGYKNFWVSLSFFYLVAQVNLLQNDSCCVCAF